MSNWIVKIYQNVIIDLNNRFAVRFLMDGRLGDIDQRLIEHIQFEGFINVLAKPRDDLFIHFTDSFGKTNCIHNGHTPRTKHEVNSGLKCVEKRFIKLDAEVVNLPYTVLNARKRPAKTAFTTRIPEHRKIFLVPDHTPTRILSDVAYHKDTFELLLTQKEIDKDTFELFSKKMDRLDVGERVAASIIHEYGHILTYNAMDFLGIENPSELYMWLDDTGYLDNCSKRIAGFADMEAPSKINNALEQLAEDYRVSHDIFNGFGLSTLPHGLTFAQDAKNKENFLEGVDCMTKVLLLDKKSKKVSSIDKETTALDFIVPFGEADRSSLSSRYTQGQINPLTKEIKKRDLEVLKEFEDNFNNMFN